MLIYHAYAVTNIFISPELERGGTSWHAENQPCPLIRPSATFSPTGEGTVLARRDG